MNFGILGTGTVGQTIGSALIQKSHSVCMGSRDRHHAKANAWKVKEGGNATVGTFEEAAAFGEVLFLCLNGQHALEAVRTVGSENISGKLVIDLTNPLDFSKGMPPRLLEGLHNSNSLGEEIQKAWPEAHLVKVLNTVTAQLMIDPSLVNNGDHHLFMCGNLAQPKRDVAQLLGTLFGWRTENILDLGTIESARLTESYIPFWVGIMQATGTHLFNVKVVK